MSNSEVSSIEQISKDHIVLEPEGPIKKLFQKMNENKNVVFVVVVLIGIFIGYYLHKKNKLKQETAKPKETKKSNDEIKQNSHNEEIISLQQQLEQQQLFSKQLLQQQQMLAQQLLLMEEQMKQQNMPKIYNPNDDIDIKKVQSKEKPEINQHNLTNSEIAEIHKQLDNFKE